jgi:MipA family protein
MKINLRLVLIFAISWVEIAQAKGGPPEGFSLGAGYVFSTSEYLGVKNNHLPMPFFSYLKGDLFIRGLSASYKVYQSSFFKAGLLLDGKFFSEGYEASDSTALRGMDERKGTVKGGGQIDLTIGYMEVKASLVKDLIGVHGGIEGELGLGMDFPVSVLFKKLPFTMIGGTLGYKFNDESFNNYYYGIKSNEVTSTRPAYVTSSSLSPFASSFLRVSRNQSWTLMTIYRLEWLAGEVKNSPIVDKVQKSSVIMFLTYKF